MPQNMAEKMVVHYEKMGEYFADKKFFDKDTVTKFAAPEFFSEKDIRRLNRMKWMQNAMFRYIAKKQGCKRPLDDKPYMKVRE